MERDDLSTILDSFIENVLEPSESFARMIQNAHVDMLMRYGKSGLKADFNDVAQVSGALTSLTRYRLQEFANLLQEQIGQVHVVQADRDTTVEYEITDVQVDSETTKPTKQ